MWHGLGSGQGGRGQGRRFLLLQRDLGVWIGQPGRAGGRGVQPQGPG